MEVCTACGASLPTIHMDQHQRCCRGGWELLMEQEAREHESPNHGPHLESRTASVLVLAGVCLRSDGPTGDVSIIGVLPGAAIGVDIRPGDVVCKVAVDDKSGGEVVMRDVRGARLELWPREVLIAANERNACFRMLILRRCGGKESMSQVEFAQVDSARLRLDFHDSSCRARAGAAICAAAREGDAEFLRLLLHSTCCSDSDLAVDAIAEAASDAPLIIAARRGHTSCVRCLLDFGADTATTTIDGKAAFYFAALEGHLACLHTLYAAGAQVDACDAHGFRALHGAALNGHSACLDALLEMGADVDAAIHDGKSAAYLAAMKGHVECLRVLRKWNADFAHGDSFMGFRPLQAAVLNGQVAAVLYLSGGSDSDVVAGARQGLAHSKGGADVSEEVDAGDAESLDTRIGRGGRGRGQGDCWTGTRVPIKDAGKDLDHEPISRRSVTNEREMQERASSRLMRRGLEEVDRHSACLFATMIAKIDGVGGCAEEEEGEVEVGAGEADRRREQGGMQTEPNEKKNQKKNSEGGATGIMQMPQRILKDLGVGYLATCYLASTLLSTTSSTSLRQR